ncbi:hypothetical protein Ccrd_010783 [Cynara cardunculus var. scolymus]|uniref:Uncharacterized protein n=1 Tax=Cynara cardunculus var. scolymus TaxID=59895 RepID=A0A118K6L2_CYNCS|nr:hypothetical protein Ccrd_010783 [Cynara cardunculus var. scolymus]
MPARIGHYDSSLHIIAIPFHVKEALHYLASWFFQNALRCDSDLTFKGIRVVSTEQLSGSLSFQPWNFPMRYVDIGIPANNKGQENPDASQNCRTKSRRGLFTIKTSLYEDIEHQIR